MQIVCNYEGVDKVEQRVENQIKASGMRITAARIAVLSLLQTFRKPLTVAEIMGLLRGKLFDQATVYRTLAALVEHGLVRPIQIHSLTTSYEAQNLPHHHHLVCEECGYVEDVYTCAVEQVTPDVEGSFSRVTGHTLEFQGICTQCDAARQVS